MGGEAHIVTVAKEALVSLKAHLCYLIEAVSLSRKYITYSRALKQSRVEMM